MFISFILARKFTGKTYASLMAVSLALVSLFSMGLPSHFPYRYRPSRWEYDPKSLLYELKSPLPLSFPFYASVQKGIYVIGPVINDYLLHFLTFEIVRGYLPLTLGVLYLHYSFFLLVNIVGAIIGYWTSKSTILERLFKTEV